MNLAYDRYECKEEEEKRKREAREEYCTKASFAPLLLSN